MVKLALLIGLNYPNDDKLRLQSSYNDIELVENYLVLNENFSRSNIIKLTDKYNQNKELNPNFFNIINRIKELVDKTDKDDILFIYFTGHGKQIKDENKDESDSKDEAFLPSDYKDYVISDDLFKQALAPCKANVTILYDACHSGTAFDLKYTYTLSPFVSSNNLDMKDNNKIICFSSSNDPNLSFSSVLPAENRGVKWFSNFTYYFIKHLANQNIKPTNRDLILTMRNDPLKTCINKGVISFSNIKIANSDFLDKIVEEEKIPEKPVDKKSYNTLLKIKNKLEKDVRIKNSIIQNYKNALHQKNMPNVDNFNAILYSIKD